MGAYTAGSCDCLNNVAEERGIPVFETPGLSRESRVAILKRCHKVEREVMRTLFGPRTMVAVSCRANLSRDRGGHGAS